MLDELRPLYDMGLALLWLKSKSKAPFELGWAKAARKRWEELEQTFDASYNVGVKLGSHSRVGDGYLAVVDCDVKGRLASHQCEMQLALDRILGEDFAAPVVASGRGNGSRHIYVRTSAPIVGRRLAQSNDTVRVLMPSVKPSKREMKELSKGELEQGYRLRPAWEISLMGEGRQVVLPPSTHPDSGDRYRWSVPIQNVAMVPLIPASIAGMTAEKAPAVAAVAAFRPVGDARLAELAASVPSSITALDDEDRSALIYKAANILLRENWTLREIQTYLTDLGNAFGEAAFGHVGSNDRDRVVRWVTKYCIEAARVKCGAASAFKEEAVIEVLGDQQAKVQEEELVPWESKLDRGQRGLRPTLRNTELILTNHFPGPLFRANLFSNRDIYGMDTPWGGKEGTHLAGSAIAEIRHWFGRTVHMEPNPGVVVEAVGIIARRYAFHPVRDYLDSLKWDGIPRLDTWLKDYLNAKEPDWYLQMIGPKILMGMVARVYQPGIKFDYIPVFEGHQGVGKSTAAEVLATPAWFMDHLPDLHDKDARLNLLGNWVIEQAELVSMKHSDTESFKSFLSSRVDKVRKHYGTMLEDFPRQSIFIGTTNQYQYMKDRTSNRRIWPVHLGKCKIAKLKEDRDQLFAEAVFRWEFQGERIFMWASEDAKIESIRELRMVKSEASEMREALLEAVEKKDPVFMKPRFSLSELFAPPGGVLNEWFRFKYRHQAAAEELHNLGWENYTSDGRRYWRRRRYFRTGKDPKNVE